MEQPNRDLAYYRGLPYTRRIRVERDAGGEYFVAVIEELSGLESDGVSDLEARYNLQLAFDDYIAALIARKAHIEEPELWPGTARRSTVVRRIITSLRRFGRAQPTSGVSAEALWIDPPDEWSPLETEWSPLETDVETSGDAVRV